MTTQVDVDQATQEDLSGLTRGDHDLLTTGLELRAEWQARSGLDPRSYALVKLAALIALDAPPASYVWQVANALDAGATPADLVGVLIAVAPGSWRPRPSSWWLSAFPFRTRHSPRHDPAGRYGCSGDARCCVRRWSAVARTWQASMWPGARRSRLSRTRTRTSASTIWNSSSSHTSRRRSRRTSRRRRRLTSRRPRLRPRRRPGNRAVVATTLGHLVAIRQLPAQHGARTCSSDRYSRGRLPRHATARCKSGHRLLRADGSKRPG